MVLKIMRPFCLFCCIEFDLFRSMLAYFILFDDAIVILLTRLYSMRMSRCVT